MPCEQAPLPPFDPDDAGGHVHTTPPPELIIPGRDNMFMRADFNGVTLNTSRWGGNVVADIKALGIAGANSTPYNMLMSPMMIMYPRKWQDAHLTESAERNLTHYVITNGAWNEAENGRSFTPQQLVEWARYVRSWGFFVTYWRGMPTLNDPYLKALVDANAIDWSIPGEEVDSRVTSEQYEDILDDTLSITANGIPVGMHTTANYPSGFPRDTFLVSWKKYDGRVHCMWQAEPKDSAGTQAARLYYARMRVNIGWNGDGPNVDGAPNSRTYAFETMATAQLYGECDEAYGTLRGLELLYATRNDDRILPMSGTGNGGNRLPDGMPF